MTAKLHQRAMAFQALVGMARTQPTAVGTSIDALIPIDNTLPQIGEGAECMSLSYTPVAVGNLLVVEAIALLSHSAPNAWLAGAIFLGTGPDALAANAAFAEQSGGGVVLTLRAYYTVAALTAHTFKFRAGPHINGTMTFNGSGAARLFGGAGVSSMQVTELAV